MAPRLEERATTRMTHHSHCCCCRQGDRLNTPLPLSLLTPSLRLAKALTAVLAE